MTLLGDLSFVDFLDFWRPKGRELKVPKLMANHPTGSTRKNWATQKNVKPTRQRCTKPTPSSWILAFIFATWTGAVHWYTRERGSMNITVWNLKHFLGMLLCFGFFTDWWIRTQYARWGRVWSRSVSVSNEIITFLHTTSATTNAFKLSCSSQISWRLGDASWLGFAKALLCLWGICCLASEPMVGEKVGDMSPKH